MRSSKARQAPVAGNTFCIAGKFYWNLCNNEEELILYLGLASEVSYLNFESNFVSSSPCSWPDLGLLIQLQITDYTSLPPSTWHSAHWTLLNVTFKLQIRFKRMNLKLKPTAIIHHKLVMVCVVLIRHWVPSSSFGFLCKPQTWPQLLTCKTERQPHNVPSWRDNTSQHYKTCFRLKYFPIFLFLVYLIYATPNFHSLNRRVNCEVFGIQMKCKTFLSK